MKVKFECSGRELRSAVRATDSRGNDEMPEPVYWLAKAILLDAGVAADIGDCVIADAEFAVVKKAIPDGMWSAEWDDENQLTGVRFATEPRPGIEDILNLAARLPSGLNDPMAAEKMIAERLELIEAIAADDYIGALTEGADAVYYAAKHLDWTARQLGVSVEVLFAIAEAKYGLRARPGNPKDDQAERAACSACVAHHL